MKGQAHIMEYVLVIFFVLFIIVMIVFFLMNWQATSTSSKQSEVFRQKASFLLRSLSTSPYLNKRTAEEGSMFEDSKLTVITCDDLQKVYGKGWYLEVKTLEFENECNEGTYPYCGRWTLCKTEGNAIAFDIPVNVYRKTTGEIDIGFLEVGLYV